MKTINIEEQIKRSVASRTNSDNLRALESASKRFDELVERGMAKPRGNNSFGIEGKISLCLNANNRFVM